MEYRQRKTLAVFLATPPWELQPGETVALKLQIRASHGIRSVIWQGDTQALSLTPPADNRDTSGWSMIMPAWSEQGPNEFRLSVVIEDDKGQKVTSNWITLQLAEPLIVNPVGDPRYELLPE
jgi:hypothetical protein